MTTEEKQAVVERAIRKAIKGGWEPPFNTDVDFIAVKLFERSPSSPLPVYADVVFDYSMDNYRLSLAHTLFWDKDFTKALWGLEPRWAGKLTNDEMIGDESCTFTNLANCTYHRMMMAFSKNPIEYLSEYLENDSEIDDDGRE